jgi:hypothetical protein
LHCYTLILNNLPAITGLQNYTLFHNFSNDLQFCFIGQK